MTTKQTLYAIRQKSTGWYIRDENPMHRTAALPSDNKAFPIRLFPIEESARKSLRSWLKGIAYQKIEYGDNGYGLQHSYNTCEVEYQKIEGREKAGLEVVAVILELP